MSDKDLDPNLVKKIDPTTATEEQRYQVMYICDETVYMLFDLERGEHIPQKVSEPISIDDLWKFQYKRVLVEEFIEDNTKTIISNFFIKVWYNDNVALDFDAYGGEKKFKINKIEGFHASMFLNVLDEYRKKKFGIIEE